MQPYYIISQLPGENEAEFILMLPFTPATKKNMIAWMAARSDGEHYGELFVYNFPKDKHVYGPMQIESRIDQNSDISKLLSLWNQRGSRVIRGNLLVIPINNSILYIEPLYLKAETSELPELKRVVVAYRDRVVMANTLDLALAEAFGAMDEQTVSDEAEKDDEEITETELLPDNVKQLTEQALNIYQKAQDALKNGNWTDYGNNIDELERILTRLEELSNTLSK